MNPRVKAWLEIVRLPNVLTAPGDPLAGLLLAMAPMQAGVPWREAGLLCGASMLIYMAGMVLNDVMDFREDLAERPERPLPSGRVGRLAALNLFGALSLGGIGLCALVGGPSVIVGAVLLCFVFAYDLGLKKVLVFGPLTMGLCRGVNLLLGVSALPSLFPDLVPGEVDFEAVTTSFFLVTIYISLVTMLARYETTARNPSFLRWLPVAALVAGLVLLITAMPSAQVSFGRVLFLVVACAAVFLAYDAGRCMRVRERVTPPMIGQLIAVLLLLQAALTGLAGHGWLCLLLLGFWPLNRWLRQRIAAS